MINDEHKISMEKLCHRLHAIPEGLTTQDAKKRLLQYGYNVLQGEKKQPLIIRFGKHLVNYFAILLWIGAILSFIAEYYAPNEGYIYIGIALAAVVVLNGVFTFIQEYQSEKIMESFKKMLPLKITALRNGKETEILASDLAPGDIIYLHEGDKIPADARLITENSLKVDNSSLTGESEPQLRKLACTHDNILESRNMVFSGTLVQTGNGTALVYATGMHTQMGNIVQLTKTTKETKNPLRKELNHFINVISGIAIFLGLTFFIINLITGNQLMGSLIFAIGIIVANVPEGLLPTVTLALSIATKRMAKKMALIKNLESVETLGSTTVICTDKTGTITENKISVNTLLINNQEHSIYERDIENTPGITKLIKIAALCNNATLETNNKYHGDPTEGALLLFANTYNNLKELQENNPRLNEYPFDSKTKRMITINKVNHKNIACLKGAPEVILEKCNHILINNRVIKLAEKHKQQITHCHKRFASRGERVLALAYKEESSATTNEDNFIFVSLVGMIDPPRKEIAGAMKKCKTAGIKVIMITGDYSLTAEAIARRAGMLDHKNANIMTGDELNQTNKRQLKAFLKKDNLIFARISPMHKLRIVKTLQELGEIVTVTGDGVNDAPALKNADMGVAMGGIGTEVAKEAANMVLLDDNFATIVKAIEEGRTIYGNIRQFIGYILTSNIPEIIPFIAFVLLGIPLALNVVLILAIDLGTDLLPALGLGAEKSEADVMHHPPRPRDQRLLDPILLFRSYGVVGMIEAAAGFTAFFTILYQNGWHWGKQLAFHNPIYMQAVAGFFACIILCQIPNVIICRTNKQSIFKKGIFNNKLVNLGILTELLLLAIIIYNPFTHNFFGTANLGVKQILIALPFMLFIFFGDELRKFLLRNKPHLLPKIFRW